MDEKDPGVIDPNLAKRWHTRLEEETKGEHWRSERHVDLPRAKDPWGAETLKAVDMIEQALANPKVTEVQANGHDKIFIRSSGAGTQLLPIKFTSEQEYNSFIEQLVVEAESIYSWADLQENRQGVLRMQDGSRLALVMPPIANEINFLIRKHTLRHASADLFVENGTMTQDMLDFLRMCVRARVNMLIVGRMGSGKSTLLSVLTEEFNSSERVAIIEQVPEIAARLDNVAYWTFQPTATAEVGTNLHDVLDISLYSGFDRVIVGEIHDEGLTKMLKIMLKGTDGTMSTYHAGDVDQAIERLKIDLQLENRNMTSQTAMNMIQHAVELVVVLGKIDGVHRCLEISEVDWRKTSAGTETLPRNKIWEFLPETKQHQVGKTGLEQGGSVERKAKYYGVAIDHEWFRDVEQMKKFLHGTQKR